MRVWTALLPLKARRERKTRLGGLLSLAERQALSKRMFDHVAATLKAHPAIHSVVLLSDQCPHDWDGHWTLDQGRGLNAELEAARSHYHADGGLLVLHGDLPLLSSGDITAMLEGVDACGVAIAPDRAGQGTNGLAMSRQNAVAFSFGPGSFHLHLAQVDSAAIIDRPGLSCDVDTPEDLAIARDAGFNWSGLNQDRMA